MAMQIDINCDLGEGFGNYIMPNDKEIMSLISSCNLACGFHAGDPSVIANSIKMAVANNVLIGAHPSFPDLQGFGRRVMNMSHDDLFHSVLYQVSAVQGIAESFGEKLHHVKPHGALYNHSAKNKDAALAIYRAISSIDPGLRVYGLPHSYHEEVAAELNMLFVAEGFGDRAYDRDGKLVSRDIKGSLLTTPEQVYDQIKKIVLDQKVQTLDGEEISISVKTICIHGDNPRSLEILKYLNENLPKDGVHIR